MTSSKLLALCFLTVAVFVIGAFGTKSSGVEAAGPESDYTCHGGSIPAGTYSSLTVDGSCRLDSGSVSVLHDVTVKHGGLLAAFGGSDLTVGKDLRVMKGAALALGCEPEAFICRNDPDQDVGTLSTNHHIGGNLIASNALAVLLHKDTIQKSVILRGGGGGVNCDPQDALHGGPAYATLEDNVIGKNAVIKDWRTCWLGFIRNTVGKNVNYRNNVTADPDGNEVVSNTISGKLNCTGNSPAAQFGDSTGSPNVVSKGATGQCVGLVAP